jgi:hypothetical protein
VTTDWLEVEGDTGTPTPKTRLLLGDRARPPPPPPPPPPTAPADTTAAAAAAT